MVISMKIILNETLRQKGKTQYWLSKQTGISAATINNICNGKTSGIQFYVLDKICKALDCTVDDIIIPDITNLPLRVKYDEPKDKVYISYPIHNKELSRHVIAIDNASENDVGKLAIEYLKAIEKIKEKDDTE